jgi:hypothetical protein
MRSATRQGQRQAPAPGRGFAWGAAGVSGPHGRCRALGRRRDPAAAKARPAAAARAPSSRRPGGCGRRAPGRSANRRRSRPRARGRAPGSAGRAPGRPARPAGGRAPTGRRPGRVGGPGAQRLGHPPLANRARPDPLRLLVGLALAVGQPRGQPRRWRVRVPAGAGGAPVGHHLAQRAAPPATGARVAGRRQQLVAIRQPLVQGDHEHAQPSGSWRLRGSSPSSSASSPTGRLSR